AFLQICKASQGREGGAFGGIAQQLLDERGGGLGAVIASTYPVHVEQSTEIAAVFYQGLARSLAGTVLGPGNELDLDALLLRRPTGEFAHWAWAFLELWVRPGPRGAFQFPRPYRGLERFEERDHDIFHGRTTDTDEVIKLLREHSAVTV